MGDAGRMRSGIGIGVRALAWLVVYVAAGKFGLRLASVNASASPVWMPSGIALAALLLHGRRLWPVVLVGAFIVNVTTAGGPWVSAGIAVGNALEAIVGAALIRRFADGADAFWRPATLARSILCAMPATALSASVGVGCLRAAGLVATHGGGLVWTTWWLGDLVGAITVAPLIALWAGSRARWREAREGTGRRPRARRVMAATVVVAVTSALAAIAFGIGAPGPLQRVPMQFCLWPGVLWAAFRAGPVATITLTTALNAIALGATLCGRGPFALDDANLGLLLLQSFIGVVTVAGLSVAGAVAERARLARELERSNAALEEYAYVASHDLKEPVRMSILHAQLLVRRRGEQLGEEGGRWARTIVEAGQRMLSLIDGLLAYARAGRAGERERVDLDRVLDDVLRDLAAAIAEAGARIERKPLPTIEAAAQDMRRLVQNLIANAVKFRDPARPPTISIEARAVGDCWELRVADDGVGIDAADLPRLFAMFARVDPREGAPGSGIGLAVCKRIADAYGGSIRAESVKGVGSTFIVVLPRNGG